RRSLGDAARTESGRLEARGLRRRGAPQHRARGAPLARRFVDDCRRDGPHPRRVDAEPAHRKLRPVPRIVDPWDRAAMKRVRTGAVGTGYLGKFHAEKYAALPEAELVGVCDIDERAGRQVAEALGVRYFKDHTELAGRVDAVTIAATTSAHFELAKYFLEHGVHVLVEKPMTRTAEQARLLTELAERKGLKLQVGHVERFNPALLSARESLTDIDFIECHRLAPFTARGADVDVVRDLMIHDLDVML